jgi:hypothetical protein
VFLCDYLSNKHTHKCNACGTSIALHTSPNLSTPADFCGQSFVHLRHQPPCSTTIPRNLPCPTHSSCFPSHRTRASLHHIHLQSPDPLAQARQPTTTTGRHFVGRQPNRLCATFDAPPKARRPRPACASATVQKNVRPRSTSVAAISVTNASVAVIAKRPTHNDAVRRN